MSDSSPKTSDSKNPSNKKELWKSIDDYNGNPELLKFKHDEFMEGVTEKFDSEKLSGISRRKFLAMLSASAAITATACTDYHDKGEIIPYNKRPEEVLPGAANYYASTCNGCEQACGILIKTREGRPVKVDGNPDHPVNQGKICAKGQASILGLYDPERLRYPLSSRSEINWKKADDEIISALNEAQKSGKEIAIVAGKIISPTTKKVLDDFTAKYPGSRIYSYELLNDEARKSAWFESYGSFEYPSVKFEEAKIILALDSDFLGNEGSYIENMRKYASKREVVGKTEFNRLYAAEGRLSSTGMMADYRFRIPPGSQLSFVYSLINELILTGAVMHAEPAVRNKVAGHSLSKFGQKEKLSSLIRDLIDNREKSIIYAGETLPKEVHIAVNLLNDLLGNSALYDYTSVYKTQIQHSKRDDFERLIDSMNNSRVGVVIHFDANPVYTLPADYGYKSALKKVGTVVSLTEAENETSEAGNYTLPIKHTFESWGDAYIRSGVYSLMQPVISPIFKSREKEAALLVWIKGSSDSYKEDSYHHYLMDNFNSSVYTKKNSLADPKTFWYSALNDGVVLFNEQVQTQKFNLSSFINSKEPVNADGYTVHLTGSYFIGDGRYANNGWLQEVPHPVSKVTWDNYASISPMLAKKIAVEMNDLIEIKLNDEIITLPVLVQPGVDDLTINVELGYGRTVVGEVGKDVGVNAVNLMSKDYSYSPFIYSGASVKKAGGTHQLASTQEHHAIDDTFVKDLHRSRKIIQEGTVKKYLNEPEFLHEEKEKIFGITDEYKYTGHKWAMAIDLNKCTGCSVCVASCNVENNIPVVGKDQVDRGREMQWMRIDRYYSGTPEDPIVSNQPMLCQHCDNAPCENVCPVNATNHSPDGLNQMVYNRCVGTRYCSNNCPYKVRRFNFFNFRDHFADSYYENNLTSLVHNPEVTVRSRGVMEKCTFCIQRIMEARSDAIRDGKELKGSDVVTACQAACPTTAITFGDANDPDSPVAKLREHNLSYHVLEGLNVKPNVTYIAKLRNTHSEEIL